MQVGTTRQGIYAALEPSGLQLPLRGDLIQSVINGDQINKLILLPFPHRAGVKTLYIILRFSESPVFLINSATLCLVPLLCFIFKDKT